MKWQTRCKCNAQRRLVLESPCDHYSPVRDTGKRALYCLVCRHGLTCHVARDLDEEKRGPSKPNLNVIRSHDFDWFDDKRR